MKKTIALLMSAACLLSLNSCFKQEDDIFDGTAAQRLNETMDSYTALLCSSENGWVLEYFANETEQGYPILMKFSDNLAVTMAGNNSVSTGGKYMEQSSTYEIIGDTGPVLTFNTFNDILSAFADPQSSPLGEGHLGDYEFQLMGTSANQDTINLLGKKHGLSMRLVKFPQGAEYTAADGSKAQINSWADYYTACDAAKSRLFNSNVKTMYMSVGDRKYTLTGMNSGVITFLPENGDPLTQTSSLGYYMHYDGLVELIAPYTGVSGEISVSKFRLADDGKSIVSVGDASNAVITSPSVTDMLLDNSLQWVIIPSTLTGGLKTHYDAVVDEVEKVFTSLGYPGTTFSYYMLRYNGSFGSYALVQNTGMGVGANGLDITKTGDAALKLETNGESDKNADNDKKNFPTTTDFLQYLAGKEYSITPASVLLPVEVKFVSKSDASDSFVVKCQAYGGIPTDLLN